MIIIGYPGVGKSTYCREYLNAIDLESSLFDRMDFVNDKAWAKCYTEIAAALHSTGDYKVCISSHKIVQEKILDLVDQDDILVIAPDVTVERDWTERLFARWVREKDDKNARAYLKSIENFSKDIGRLKKNFKHVYLIGKDELNVSPVELFSKACDIFLEEKNERA